MHLKYLVLLRRNDNTCAPCTPLQERRERHRQNYMHITIHTSQTWADTFISELNDTHVEAELRTRNIPPLVRSPREAGWHGALCASLVCRAAV